MHATACMQCGIKGWLGGLDSYIRQPTMDTVISNSDVMIPNASLGSFSSSDVKESSSTSGDSEDYDKISFSSNVMFENLGAINEEIDIIELKELQDLLIGLLKSLKMDEFIKFLRTKKQTVDQSYRKQNAAVSTLSGVSAVGGGIMFAGGVSAIVTLGGSLSLVIAGGVTVGIGTFGTVTAQVAGKLRRRLIIRQCKKQLKDIESHTKKIGDVYEQFREKCTVVCQTLEELQLSIENLKEVDPIIFKFALIGGLNTPKVAVLAGATSAGTHVATTVHAGHFVHLRFLGKALIPAFKITEAVLGIGMAISGIGIALDLIVGGKAMYDLVKGTECSESRSISEAINRAEEHAKHIKSFLHLLETDGKDLLTKAIDSTKSTKQQLQDKTDTIKQLRTIDDQQRAEIERFRAENERLQRELSKYQSSTA